MTPLWQQFLDKGLDAPRCDHAEEPGPRCDLCGEHLTPLDAAIAAGITSPSRPDLDTSWWDADVPEGDDDPLVEYVNAKFDSGKWS